ncbi:MAG: ATP-dependent helicase [Thermodesulfobacteriota bacterium]
MERRIPYKEVLNESQYSAVTAPDGPILVIAGAGSGKTRTLVYRVAWLVEGGIPPHEILLLTFTRKAAREMLDRAASMTDQRCREVSGGTFHSLARQVLRRDAQRVGLASNFTIMDRSDMEEAAHALIPEVDGENSPIRLPKSATISTILSKAANMERSVEDIMEAEYPQFLPVLARIERLQEIYRDYKRKNNLMDYDDLIIFLRLLLQEDEQVRTELGTRYRYIMVDEYQDTNAIQADIVRYLGSLHKNVMVVGDDSQSIYSFRGANFRNMFEFPVHFPDARIIKLEKNYRSTQPILTLTNALMEQAKEKYTKCLYATREGTEVPLSVNAGTERDQAAYVGRSIEALVDEGRKLRDIAVLFRASYHSFELELELTRRNIPFVKYGGFKFIESAHIKDLLAHLRVVANKTDILSWGRLLRLLKNIGPAKSHAIIDWMRQEGISPARVNEWPGIGKEKQALDRLAMLLAALSTPKLAPETGVDLAIDYYVPFLKERFDDYPRRQQELEQLTTMATRYKTLRSFLDDISLEPPASPADVRPIDKSDYLTLSTIHSAKGLEWEAVFIIWLVDGKFPSAKSFAHMDNLEEELRLLYVAATRAKDKLIMTYPGHELLQWTGAGRRNSQGEASSFIRALPPDVIEHRPFLRLSMHSYADSSRPNPIARSIDSDEESKELRPGDKVNHPAFGVGVIARFEGDDKVEVIFRDTGTKLLHLGYTTLDKI